MQEGFGRLGHSFDSSGMNPNRLPMQDTSIKIAKKSLGLPAMQLLLDYVTPPIKTSDMQSAVPPCLVGHRERSLSAALLPTCKDTLKISNPISVASLCALQLLLQFTCPSRTEFVLSLARHGL